MSSLSLSRCALSVCVTAIVVAGCGRSQGPGTLPISSYEPPRYESSAPDRPAQPGVNFKHLFSFNFKDGALPGGDLTSLAGSLFSTTQIGGGSDCSYSCFGTVFKITTSGKETVIHKFDSSGVGAYPMAGLVTVNGSLYGTTNGGGCCYGKGTVFKITTAGKFSVLYEFKGAPDGEYPGSSLTNVNGALYGTTEGGGANDDGTVFKVTMSGSERVLHSFSVTDGADPEAGLTNVNGILYGATCSGGSAGKYGTVFKITTSGKMRVLISFNGANGACPKARLTSVGGALYGTTSGGGAYGLGTVFEITTSGIEKVLHSFEGGIDGAYPTAHLLDVNGELYGTTGLGGGGPCYGREGCGTVFKITRSGSQVVLHRFQGTDGSGPAAGLTHVYGALYGTTGGGGGGPCPYRCGTVFKLSP